MANYGALLLLLAAILSSLIGWAAAKDAPPRSTDVCTSAKESVARGTASVKLKSFLAKQWIYLMHEFPEQATMVGFPGQNDRLTDQSLAALERRRRGTRCQVAALEKISRAQLRANDRINFDLSLRSLKMDIESESFGDDYLPVNHMIGFQIDFIDLLQAMPTATKEDLNNIVSRLELVPHTVDNLIIRMREGVVHGITPPRVLLPKVSQQLNALLTPNIEDSALYKPFTEGFGGADTDLKLIRLRVHGILERKTYPALLKLRDFIDQEYSPKARTSIGWSELPNGKAWYAFEAKLATTTDQTPDELHRTGLSEVARIRLAMNKVKDEVSFRGDLKDFNKFLLTNGKFYFTEPEAMLTAYRNITKQIDPELVKMFKTLPRLTYGIKALPDFRVTSASSGEYQPGSLEAGRPGYFQANTYDLKSRPKWEMETLAFHETVPGHHLQGAIAQEIVGVPEFRKYGGNDAFVEGWALYAESLGEEMGFYKDPYSKYGHYSGEMLRAVRLVVDTGMHAKGWSRQQALDYFRAQMPVSDIDSENEINRYIVMPGQALAYKVGQLKFRELRERAKQKLGSKFDVREYHDTVLGQGALPMDELEKVVDEWIAARKGQGGAAAGG